MRRSAPLIVLVASILVAVGPLAAQDAAEAPPSSSLLTPNGGLIVWTLVIFLILFVILAKFAFGPITEQVRQREQALADALESAKRDRAEAAKLLEEQRALLVSSRDEGQKLIADARGVSEQMRQDIVTQAHAQQTDILNRTREEIRNERDKAIAELRREAIDLAILGASRVIEKNLDDATNRELVERFLASVTPSDGPRR
jgi:F-type H+-transporting ATPase subunit b